MRWLLCLFLAGCATAPMPYCEAPRHQFVAAEDGSRYLLFDLENAVKLAKVLNGLSDGSCRLAKGES